MYLTAALACILVLVVTGWFIDHVQTHQLAHDKEKTLLKTRQEAVRLAGKLKHFTKGTSAKIKQELMNQEAKMKQEALLLATDTLQQQMAEYEKQGLARAEALLGEETAMRRKLDYMLDEEKDARIIAQTLHAEEKELRMQLEAQHEELEKQHASLKTL